MHAIAILLVPARKPRSHALAANCRKPSNSRPTSEVLQVISARAASYSQSLTPYWQTQRGYARPVTAICGDAKEPVSQRRGLRLAASLRD